MRGFFAGAVGAFFGSAGMAFAGAFVPFPAAGSTGAAALIGAVVAIAGIRYVQKRSK